jgi:ribose transport system substrate-binding protein
MKEGSMKRDRDVAGTRHPWRLGGLIVLALAVAAALSTATTGTSAPNATACGALPTVAPQDADRTLARATTTAKGFYNGWPFPLRKSALANWKPKGQAPYTVGVLFDGLSNPFQAYTFNLLQKFLNRAKNVDRVIGVVAEAGNSAKEIQAYQSLVQQGADVIIVQPASAPALVAPMKAALNQGVATIGYINPIDDAAAVNVAPNVYTSAGASLAAFLKLLGAKGNLLGVHGIRVTQVDRTTWEIFNRLLDACPDVKLAGEIDGNFAPPAVRAAVLQYLATNPGKVDGVFHTATMGASIIGAFQQAGRDVPPVTAMAAQKGELAYWSQNRSNYRTVGFAGGANALANLITRVTLRMLAGQGPKLNHIPWPQPQITAANLSQYARPGWTLATPGAAEQPASTFWKEKDLDSLFTFPKRKTGGF